MITHEININDLFEIKSLSMEELRLLILKPDPGLKYDIQDMDATTIYVIIQDGARLGRTTSWMPERFIDSMPNPIRNICITICTTNVNRPSLSKKF